MARWTACDEYDHWRNGSCETCSPEPDPDDPGPEDDPYVLLDPGPEDDPYVLRPADLRRAA